MITEPKMEDRKEQAYVGIRTQVPMKEFSKIIPKLHKEVNKWLTKQGITPSGAPFMRFHVINMESDMDIEIGVPVASAVEGNGHVQAGVIPAGRYASLIYTGVRNGIRGNKALLEWVAEMGLKLDRWDVETGDAFAARYESYLTDPADEPDKKKWETEVAIRLADN